MSEQQYHPELHVYEEERNDLIDVAVGFGGFFGVLFLIALVATIVSLLMK
ncbi:YqzM family protein [Paenibacillus chartarius]|uniref:YqzM family protein n=1 Tax=Paenibacillus chartarius TaxID=747481 RepID=A0ABV6DFA3_9BACL